MPFQNYKGSFGTEKKAMINVCRYTFFSLFSICKLFYLMFFWGLKELALQVIGGHGVYTDLQFPWVFSEGGVHTC